MSKVKLMLDVVNDMRSLADSIQAVCDAMMESDSAPKEVPATKTETAKEPQTGGIVTCRNITVRERILRFLLGDKQRVTILIPGDSVEELAICETTKGGSDLEQNKVTA